MKLKSLSKPSSHKDRSAIKKPKSQKRKRRYSSSDSADSARKKPRKSKKSKKKPKKKPRKVSVSPTPSSCSSDYSASSCSTCEKRKASRSRSPISRSNGNSKPRKGRVSSGSKYKGKERGRSRRRSPSCSTCSRSSSYSERSRSSSRSRSPKRSKRPLKDKEKAKKSEVSRVAELEVEEREKVIPSYDDIIPPSKEEEKQMQTGTTESELVAEEGNKVVPIKTENDDGAKKTGVVDVELILRQKALENFIKFHKVKKCGISDESGKAVLNEPNKEVGSAPCVMINGKEIEEPTLEEPTKVRTNMDSKEKGEIMSDISVKRPKLRSVIVVPTEKEVGEDNITTGAYSADEVPNGIKEVPDHIEEEPDKGSEPNPNLNLEVPDPSLLVVTGLTKDETIAAAVEQGGTQYEKKTFSRMHEGETVQVSYKVYIPKKAPALARRKLQRGETSAS